MGESKCGTNQSYPEYMERVPHHLTPNPHLAPHLRELCSVLATGIVRLRRRTAEELARDAAQAGPDGETALHFTTHQSGHADANRRRHA